MRPLIRRLAFGIASVVFGATAVFLTGSARATWEPAPKNPNLALLAATPSDVILDGSVDLLEYVRSQDGLAAENYAPPLIVPAADFDGDSPSSSYFYSFNGYFSAGSGCFQAPVYLPLGSTINNFFAFLYDNGASNMSLSLFRKFNNTTASATILATVTTSGASTSIQIVGDTTVDTPVVTADYSYFAAGCWPEASGPYRIQGLWIFYTGP